VREGGCVARSSGVAERREAARGSKRRRQFCCSGGSDRSSGVAERREVPVVLRPAASSRRASDGSAGVRRDGVVVRRGRDGATGARYGWRRRRRWSKLAWLERRRGCRWAGAGDGEKKKENYKATV
ncbi:hypothetical protein U1Q18_015602, partial [Sarracenia purpurea var. burkii]